MFSRRAGIRPNVFGGTGRVDAPLNGNMAAIPGEIDTAHQPPMAVPLRHFVVALGFLVLGTAVAAALALDLLTGFARLAHVHLLLAGWICVTIMGAMTQFVPVWSGTGLHSRRLSHWQLWLVTGGLLGFSTSLIIGRPAWTVPFGAAMLAGFWTFVYNIGRTLQPLPSYDVTERHFGLAIGFFLLVTALGFGLALDFALPVFASLPVTRVAVIQAHATLAVFGAVLTTVIGALYQLATMFTQTDLHGIDHWFRRLEEVGYPVGVVLLAAGRLWGSVPVARIGGLLVVLSLLGFSVILGRRLYEAQVPWTPMLSRYAVAAPALALWGLLTVPAWFSRPLSPTTTFGAPGVVHILGLGVIGFVVLGTLYHVVPFIIWVHRYSDRLGYESVPMIDDLYSDRIATADLTCFLVGTAGIVAVDLVGGLRGMEWIGAMVLLLGATLFAANIFLVIRRHAPRNLILGRVPWSTAGSK